MQTTRPIMQAYEMKHETYETLYQAHLGNVDRKALEAARAREEDPFFRNIIDLTLEKTTVRINWDVRPFTDGFRTGASPRERLDETFVTFVLRLVALHKEEQYMRAFRKPGSFDALMAWEALLRETLLCSLALLYGVRWTVEAVFEFLEPAVLRLLGGDPFALRELMTSVGARPVRETPHLAEVEFGRLNFMHVGQYSSMYWRYLHWMAEAFDLRSGDPGMAFYRRRWLELLQGPLYRTLRCGVCMYHFKNMLVESRAQLAASDVDLSRLVFEWHNRVHALRREQYPFLQEPDYDESDFGADRQFMREALSAPRLETEPR